MRWYGACLQRQNGMAQKRGNAVAFLDLDSLVGRVREANTVRYFGGASLLLL
jgi:hypothetical protein